MKNILQIYVGIEDNKKLFFLKQCFPWPPSNNVVLCIRVDQSVPLPGTYKIWSGFSWMIKSFTLVDGDADR